MELERDERVVRPGRVLWPFAETLVGTVAIFLFELPAGLLVASLCGLLLAVHAAAILYHARRVVVTDRRIVEYRPALAWLARRWRTLGGVDLARLERDRRRSIDLLDVAGTRNSGNHVRVATASGDEHVIACRNDAEASLTRYEIEADARTAQRRYHEGLIERARLERRFAAVGSEIHVSRDAAGPPVTPARCPYCHDDVTALDAPCERCGAVHHAECLEIHGRCAVLACGGRAAPPPRAEVPA